MYKITTGKKWEFIVVIRYIAITYKRAGKSSGSFEKFVVGRENGSILPTIEILSK